MSCAASSGASFIGSITNEQVDLAALEPRFELVVDRRLRELDLHFRERLLEPADERGEEARADALVGADAERPGRALGERREIGLCGLHPRDDRLRVAKQQLPGLGERDRPRPARALDQLLADGTFQCRHLLADRRLGVAERARGTAERAVLRDGLESEEVP